MFLFVGLRVLFWWIRDETMGLHGQMIDGNADFLAELLLVFGDTVVCFLEKVCALTSILWADRWTSVRRSSPLSVAVLNSAVAREAPNSIVTTAIAQNAASSDPKLRKYLFCLLDVPSTKARAVFAVACRMNNST
jgi:hypothetical protein